MDESGFVNAFGGGGNSPLSLVGTGGAALSGAMAGASLGPMGMAAGAIVGIGLQLFGGASQMKAAKEYNAAQIRQIQAEKAVEAQRMQANERMASRLKLENLRRVQMAQAMGLQAATNQGVGTGSNSSALAGGQAQASAQGNWNALGINQSLYTARNIYSLTQQINDEKIAMANAGMDMQKGQAISQLGTSITSNLGALGRLTGFGATQFNNMFGGNTGNPLGQGNILGGGNDIS